MSRFGSKFVFIFAEIYFCRMKKKRLDWMMRLHYAAGLVLCLLGCAACDDEVTVRVVWSYAPKSIELGIENAAGEDLLNPATEGYLVNETFSMQFRDSVYLCRGVDASIPEDSLVFHVGYNEPTDRYFLSFGKFFCDTTSGYHNEPFALLWEGGNRTSGSFDFFVTWDEETERPTVHQSLSVEGVEVSDKSLQTVLVR